MVDQNTSNQDEVALMQISMKVECTKYNAAAKVKELTRDDMIFSSAM